MPLSEFPRAPEDVAGDEPPLLRTPPPGPMSKSASARLAKVDCPAFGARRDARAEASGVDHEGIVLQSGRGSNVVDVDGNRYVDLAAGFGALALGHCAPPVVRALEAQADRLTLALGDVYSADAKVALLERLAALLPNGRVILAQSGSDAVTAAIKTAMLATKKPGLIAFEGAYHGLGYAPLPACGLRSSYRAPFAEQLNAHVHFAKYPRGDHELEVSLASVEAAFAKGGVGALLIEPILGRGGCVVPPDGFLREVFALAKSNGALVIADEIWTGLGRSGAMTRSGALGLTPDLICFGKALGGGLPIAACVGTDDVMQAWANAEHGEVVHTSTHAGSPLACAAAVATLDTIRFRKLVARAETVGAAFLADLQVALMGKPKVVEVRGAGLMIGVELESGKAGAFVARALLRRGYLALTGGASGETLTLTPALTIDEERLREAGRAIAESVAEAR